MTDPASYRSEKKFDSLEKKLTRPVINSRQFKNSLRKILLVISFLLLNAVIKLTSAGADTYSATYSDSVTTVLNSFPLTITVPAGTTDTPHNLHTLSGSVIATCNTDTGNCTITPDLHFDYNNLSITEPKSGSWNSGGFAALWMNPPGGGDTHIYLSASIIDGALWDTFFVYAYAQHMDVPEIPVGAAAPLALLLSAGIFCLRTKRRTT